MDTVNASADAAVVAGSGQHYPGQRLGLPEQGAGSIAGFGSRVAALVLDLIVGGLIGALLNAALHLSSTSSWRFLTSTGAFAVEVALLVALTGQTLGMRVIGLRVRQLVAAGRPAAGAAVVRTVLLLLLVPALVWDRDQRGLHDKVAGTVVVRG